MKSSKAKAGLPALRTGPLPPILHNHAEVQLDPADVDWDDPAELPAYNANQVNVLNQAGQIHLNFYELLPPIALTPQAMKAIKKVRARGRARITISPQFAAVLAQALQQSLSANRLPPSIPG